MDQTNRAIIVSGALCFICLVLIIVMVAWGAPEDGIDRLFRLANYVEDHNNDQAKLIVTFGGFILALAALLLIVYEITPPQSGDIKIEVGSGDVRISTEEIAMRIESEIRGMPQVQDVQATVIGRGSKAEVSLALHVHPEAELAATAGEACGRARELVERQMGVGLASQPRAELHYRELKVARAVSPQPADAGSAGEISRESVEPWARPGVSTPMEAQQVAHEAEAASESPPSGP
jgi:hypothetical protein